VKFLLLHSPSQLQLPTGATTEVGCWPVLSLETRLVAAHYPEGALHLRHQARSFLCTVEILAQRWQQVIADLQQAVSHTGGTF